MKRKWLFGLATLVLIPAALFLFMKDSWDAGNHEHASADEIQQVLQADRVLEVGPMESDLLETPRLYGYMVEAGKYRQVAVFDREGSDHHYLLIMPGQPLGDADLQAEADLQSFLADQGTVRVLSRHEVVRVQGQDRQTLPQPFYKVTFQANNVSYLVFYQDEQNKISAFENGYAKLQNF